MQTHIGAALACIFLAVPIGGCAQDPAQTGRLLARPARTSFVVILSDDLNTNLGAYGSAQAHTPAIDALASRSQRFDRAYCQSPICNASRGSLLSGLRPETIQILTNEVRLLEVRPDVLTLPQLFREGGYWTGAVGKVFHHPGEGASLWDEYVSSAATVSILHEIFKAGYTSKKGDDPEARPRARREFLAPFEVENPRDRPVVFGPTLLDDDDYQDGRNVQQVIAWLEARALDQLPFFIMCGIDSPHQPISAPEPYFDLHPPEGIRFEPDPADDWDDIPPIALSSRHETFGVPPGDDDRRRAVTAAYRACVSFTDAQLGRIVAALDRLELWETTAVVFTSDHGFHLGEHGMWSKGTLFEESTRVPLIVHAPGHTRTGTSSSAVVELVDLFPTLAELAELPRPPQLEGLSFVALLGDPDRRWKQGAFCSVARNLRQGYMGRSVRTPRWRYTEWTTRDGVAAELYDLEGDPREHDNLAVESAHAGRVAELGELLVGGWRAALPSTE